MSDSEDEIPRYSPQLVRETYTTGRVFKNPRVEYFKEIIRKNQGQNQLPLKDLEFYKSEILSQIPLAQITRKKVRDFCKASPLESQRQRALHFQLYNRSRWERFSSIRGP